jgi:hypothetical protein
MEAEVQHPACMMFVPPTRYDFVAAYGNNTELRRDVKVALPALWVGRSMFYGRLNPALPAK